MSPPALAWVCRVDESALLAAVPQGIRELAPGELARLRRLRMPRRRRQFLTGHVLARLAVRHWLVEADLEGAAWSLDQAADGRPELRVAEAGPAGVGLAGAGLSIAHSGDRVAVLVAPVVGCGVDVEAGPASPYLAELMLEPHERPELLRHDRAALARRRWVLREAYAKASGVPLDDLPRVVLGEVVLGEGVLGEVVLGGGVLGDAALSGVPAGGRRWDVHTWQDEGADLAVVLESVPDGAIPQLVVRRGLDVRPLSDAVPG